MSLPIENHVIISNSGKITVDGKELLVEMDGVEFLNVGGNGDVVRLRLTLIPTSITVENRTDGL